MGTFIALLRHWHNKHGMTQGLVQPADLICLHVDRFCFNGQGQVVKNQTPIGIHWGLDVPVLSHSRWH